MAAFFHLKFKRSLSFALNRASEIIFNYYFRRLFAVAPEWSKLKKFYHADFVMIFIEKIIIPRDKLADS